MSEISYTDNGGNTILRYMSTHLPNNMSCLRQKSSPCLFLGTVAAWWILGKR